MCCNTKIKIMFKKSKKGFSLVELLVVITIIAILSVVAYMAIGGQTTKARNSRRMQDLSTLQSVLESYAISNSNKYPATITSVDLTTQYISKIPTDPSTSLPYKYATGAGAKTYQLGAYLEDETGGLASKSYVIGNGTGLLTTGCTYTPATGVCNCASPCTANDGDTTCVPYCLL